MNPSVGKILNALYQKASASSPSTQAAGPSQEAFSSAPPGPSSTVPPNAITCSSAYSFGWRCERRFDLLPCKPFIGQDENFQRVCESLQDSKVGKVGIYGMGGVGKTSLIKRIHNEYLAFSDFDLIIWIPLHKDDDYQHIWKIIDVKERVRTWFYFPSDGIGNRVEGFPSNFLGGIMGVPSRRNAAQLYNFLRRKKFALVLDNMWEYVDLEELGIPDPTEENMCKIVFTTRSEEVCRPMNPDVEIKVECLGRSDSWALFEKSVGEKSLNSDPWVVRGIAQQVVEECGGLPLALITVGRAMSSRCGRARWENALALLRSYPYEFQGIEKQLYHSLKFSYDALENETIKQCFLYCSLFPECFHINQEKLVEYWMGEGYLGESESLKVLKNRGSEIIGVLESVCLLECGSGGRVKMHDVVRDMALWIVSGYGKVKDRFFVHHQTSRRLGRFVIAEKWSNANKIFVMDLVDLPDQPSCPNLSTLLFEEKIPPIMFTQYVMHEQTVKGKDSDRPRPLPGMRDAIGDLFENMPRLRVLELSSLPIPGVVSRLVALRYLSGSPIRCSEINVGSLNNLWFLHLTGPFKEENLCIIGLDQLTELRQLNLKGCNLETLPVEVGRLTKLEILVLCRSFCKLPSNIGRLIELRELHADFSRLQSLPEEVGALTKLGILILTGSQIRTLPGTIGLLIELQHLALKDLQLERLPEEIGGLTKLQTLDLTRASISALPSTVGRLAELTELILSHSKLEILPPQIGNLIKLKILHLDNACNIYELPSTIGQLIDLRELTLGHTSLATLPVEVGNLTNLRKLDLTCTGIKELPSSIGQLSNLTCLKLEETELETLPRSVDQMTKLESLSLRNTLITELPSTLGQLVNLRYLNLRRTKLKALPLEVGGMTKLKALNLGCTNMIELPSTVGGLVSLMHLNLERTNLRMLPAEVGGMTKLKDLNLSYTDITELPSTMEQLVNLQNLNLRGTNLKALPKELKDLANLKIIT